MEQNDREEDERAKFNFLFLKHFAQKTSINMFENRFKIVENVIEFIVKFVNGLIES